MEEVGVKYPGLDREISAKVDEWLAIDNNDATRKEILDLVEAKNAAELCARLGTDIAFGTAGLRARMEAGFSRMNTVTVLRASQGLCEYLETFVGSEPNSARSVVVGFDHRYNSRHFAYITAFTFLQRNFRVHLFGYKDKEIHQKDTFVHTPLVPFGIDRIRAAAGVMITASHNPARDNGYKVYWGNGCQIIPPHDSGIAACIAEPANSVPWRPEWDYDTIRLTLRAAYEAGQLVDDTEEVEAAYLAAVKAQLLGETPQIPQNIRFVYTPMHGVGRRIVAQLVQGILSSDQFTVVAEQAEPDPAFPTVAFPNPEEVGALQLAQTLGSQVKADIVLANDPDADRFTASLRDSETGQWQQLTGNELGLLFADYVLHDYATRHSDLSRLVMLRSTVSSGALGAMAAHEGFRSFETLTGFKWLGNRARDCEAEGSDVPFAFEEAIGYMFSVVHDKDGVSALAVFLRMAAKWRSDGVTGLQRLAQLYDRYGYFAEHNSYYVAQRPEIVDKVFADIRKSSGAGPAYPERIGSEFHVVYWRDLTVGYDSSTADHIPELPVSSSSQMITAEVQPVGELRRSKLSKVRFTCRGSGTEPKLKVYIEAVDENLENAEWLARLTWDVLAREWFSPERTGLVAREAV